MRRGLAILAPAVSALLLLATLRFWVRSYSLEEGVSSTKDNRILIAVYDRGGVLIAHCAFLVPGGAKVSLTPTPEFHVIHFPPVGYLPALAALQPSPSPRFLGFSVAIGQETGTSRLRYRITAVAFPLWFPAVLFAIPPAWWLARMRNRRLRDARRRNGLCVACGYDLRASPGPCPECGEADQNLSPS